MSLSLLGIFLGLVLLTILAYRGNSIIWVAPAAAAVVTLLSGMNVLDTYIGAYMQGVAGYLVQWFPAFFLGAVYGKIMDMTGSARSLADVVVKILGTKRAIAAVVVPCLLMTFGGISLFVVVFVMYPMGYAIFRASNIPRTLLPGAIAMGAFGITMTCLPGTPQIQNLIPTEFFGTTPTAAPVLGIVAAILILVPGYIYMDMKARKAQREGRGFVEDPKFVESVQNRDDLPSWHWLASILPIISVVIVLNVFKQHIAVALLSGIAVCCLMNIKQYKTLLPSISEGANSSLSAIMNTSCAVGFGSVVKIVPGFGALTTMMMNFPGGVLLSVAATVAVLAGATGSASGGMSIALSALAPQWLEKAVAVGINPEYLHRIAAIAADGLDTLPHNGAVLTLLAVTNCTHKESYIDIFITSCIIPSVVAFGAALVLGLFA